MSEVAGKVKIDDRHRGQKYYAPGHSIRGHENRNVSKLGKELLTWLISNMKVESPTETLSSDRILV